MTSKTLGTVSEVIARERTQVLITFQHNHVTQRLVGTYSVGSKTKRIYYIRPRLRPRPKLEDQDQKYKTMTKTATGLRPVLS